MFPLYSFICFPLYIIRGGGLGIREFCLGNDVADGEAALAGFEIQDEDAVFGLLNETLADNGDDN